MDPQAQRVEQNESAFRDANERLRLSAERLRFENEDRVPFICECRDIECTTPVMLSLAEYAAVREHPRRFVLAPGHEDSRYERLVEAERKQRYVVVEKNGAAGDEAVKRQAQTR